MADHILTPYGRLSFPDLAEPRAFEGGEPKFGAALLFPKAENIGKKRPDDEPFSPWNDASKHDLSEIEKILEEVIASKWPKQVPKKLRRPLKDGDDETWDGYAGHLFIRSSSKRPPKLIDTRKRPVTGQEIEQVFYPGCWVRAVINPFTYDKAGNVGVSFGLQALQFVRDDNPFVGINMDEAFDDLPENDLAPDELDGLE